MWIRVWVPTLAVGIVGAVVVGTLLQAPANVYDRPIVPRVRSMPTAPIDLGVTRLDDGTRRAVVGLQTQDARSYDSHREIWLSVVSWGDRPRLVDASLTVVASGCVYRTRPGAALVNNASLELVRMPGCQAPAERTDAASGRIDVEILYRGDSRIGLLAEMWPRDDVQAGWLRFAAETAGSARVPVVRGRLIDDRPGAAWRRVELLAYLWGRPEAARWIWGAVAGGLALIGLGVWLIVRAPGGSVSIGRQMAAAGVSAAALAGGLALLYVVTVPPLQAPDEPDHLLSYAHAVGLDGFEPALATFARTAHFDRIHFDGAERFLPADIGRPIAIAWDPAEIFQLDVSGRSLTAALWWRVVHGVAAPTDVGATILAVRTANVLLFGLAMGLAAALLHVATRGVSESGPVGVLGLLLIPTLPFFSMHVSEFSVLSSAYVLAAAAAAGLFLDGPYARWLGLPLGVATALVLLSGRSGLPYVAVLGGVMAARALLGTATEDAGRAGVRSAAVFWGGLAAGLALVPLLTTPGFEAGLWPGDAGKRIPGWFRRVAETGRQHPVLVVLAAGLGFVVDRLVGLVRVRLQVPRWTLLNRVTRVVVAGAGAVVAASLAISLMVRYPMLVDLGQASPGLREYVTDVFRSMLTSPRLWDHDFLLATSFWAAFGWVDTIPPEWFITAVVVTHTLVAVSLLVYLARHEPWRRMAWLVLLGVGWAAALGAYAVSLYFLHRNLHGRYLLGFYLSLLCVVWSAPSLPQFRERISATLGRLPLTLEPALVLAVAGVHAYALRVILTRYF